MRILIISLVLVGLSSCAMKPENKDTVVVPPVVISAENPTIQTGTVEPTQIVEKVVGSGSLTSLNYTLRDGSADGKVLETTLQSVAQANGLFKPDANYTPFQVMIGANSVIVGFEKGLMGMKKGEKKIIRVSPEEGYGTEPRSQEVPKSQIAPVFTIKQPMKAFDSTVSQTVSKAELNDEMKNSQVGQTLTGANGVTARVTAVTETDITFEIDNLDNPFYKKTIAVGATNENESASFKITKIENDEVTVEITNKQSPFYNKNFQVGESFTLPQGGKITVTAINEDMVTISELHPMAGKTLFFDVEVTDIQ